MTLEMVYHKRNVHQTPSIRPEEVQSNCESNWHEQDNDEDNSVNPVNVKLEVNDDVKQQQHLCMWQTGSFTEYKQSKIELT